MAKDVITRFKLETTGFDSKIKQASKELSDYSKTATQAKEGFNQFTKANVDAARALGSMSTSTDNAKDKMKELVGAYNEAAKAYNQLTKEQQQSDWAKALSGSLTQLQQRIRETKQEMQGLSESTGGIFSGDKLSGMLQVFGGNLMTKAAGYAMDFATGIGECVKEGIELAKQGEGIRIAFERLGRGDILQGLRDATHGTVTDLELMKAAVKFNDFKLPLEELGTMLAFAQQKAKDTGQSVDYMVDSIVTGLGRKSLMILDNLGLSATEVKEKMAETGDMTKAVGAIIREQMSKAGDYIETAADRATQAHVSLQNKMEELGRLYQPLQEASNTFWTSMKVSILDVVAGPLAKLMNGLTEAGSQMKMLQNANGGQNGERTRVNSQLDTLKNVRRSGSDFMVNRIYSKQVEDYNRQIVDIDTMLKQSKGVDKGSILKKASEQFGQDFFSTHELKRYQEALRTMRDQYISGAKDIMTPVKVDIKTDNAEKNVDSLRVKLAELEAQRKKAIKAGDQDLAKNLTKQITQTKSDIKALDPNALKTTTTHTLTKPEQADAKYVQAQKDYNQALEQAAMEVKAGTITSAEGKKKELQATETLWKAIGDAREVYDSPKLQEEQKKVEAAYTELAGETSAAIEAQKAAEKTARELEAAQKRLADAQNELADAQASGDLKKIYAAEKKVETAQVQVDARTSTSTGEQKAVEVPITISNLEALKQHLTEEMTTTPVGDSLLQNMQEAFSDASAIGTIFSTAVKNGIDTATFDTSGIMEKLLNNKDIDDDIITSYVDQLNEQLKMKFDETEWPNVLITFNAETKQIENAAKKQLDDAKKTQQAWGMAAQSVNNLSTALANIEDPGAKAMGTVIKAIADISLGFAQASVQASSLGPWGWLAWLAAGTAAMATTISSVHSLTGFADGGIIKGNSYSGDRIGGMVDGSQFVGLNAGELVLNKSQQMNLASQLEGGGMGGLHLSTVVTAEDIKFILNNNGERIGVGEYFEP